jgi:hypothetical protein
MLPEKYSALFQGGKMMPGHIHYDGSVSGSISSDGTRGTIKSKVSCVKGRPEGSFSGTVEFWQGGYLRKFKFSSTTPYLVATLRSNKVQSVRAAFSNVSVQEDEQTPVTNAKGYYLATKVSPNTWLGSFNVNYPDGRRLLIEGIFTGQVAAVKQVYCQPLLAHGYWLENLALHQPENNFAQADSFVRGSIEAQNGAEAKLEAKVSCYHGLPTGYISGTVVLFDSIRGKFKFTSSKPSQVDTIKSGDTQQILAIFENVTLHGKTEIPNTRIVLQVQKVPSGAMVGSLKITPPGGGDSFVYGTLKGIVKVNRQVFCEIPA